MSRSSSSIKAGAGRVPIKFPENFFPYHGFSRRLLTGIHDEIYVRSVMITNDTDGILFISVDTGDLSDAWLPEISDFSGLPAENIFLTATHTHEAPYIDRTIPEIVEDAAKTGPFIEKFREALKESIETAKRTLVLSRIGFGTGSCAANVNRDVRQPNGNYKTGVNPHGPSDHTVSVLRVEDMSGQPIAFLTNYAVHSSIMLFTKVFEGGMLVSGDLAGAAMRYVEDQTGAVSLFTMGAAGDQGPLFTASRLVVNPDGSKSRVDEGEAGFALVRALGSLLGTEIVRVGNAITDTGMTETAAISAACGIVTAPGQKKAEIRPGISLPPEFEYEDGDPSVLRLSLIRLNDIGFAGVPGEIMNSIGADIQRALREKGCEKAVVITQCNGSNSYMGDDEAYDLHKFAANASYVKKGIAGILVNGYSELADQLASL